MPKQINGGLDGGRTQIAPLADRLKSRVSDLQARAEKVQERVDQLHKTAERMHHDAREAREAAQHINQKHQVRWRSLIFGNLLAFQPDTDQLMTRLPGAGGDVGLDRE